MQGQSLRRMALIATVIGFSGLLVNPPAALAAPTPPHVQGTETVPVYDYTNAIRESIRVTTPNDNDGDGVLDKIVVDINRPRETAQAGIKIPVIMDASPYYKRCGRGNESELKEYDANGNIVKFPLFYDNYFVPRGYAFAAADFNGTNRSTGCGDAAGHEEITGAN